MMTFKELKELLSHINELEVKEVRLKDKDFELRVRTALDTEAPIISSAPYAQAPMLPAQMAHAAPTMSTASGLTPAVEKPASEPQAEKLIPIKSPMVGTFYRASSPDKPSYVQVGDAVTKGSVVCVIEAMKLFNEIESEVSGKIVKVMVEDASPVEYDQVLFMVEL